MDKSLTGLCMNTDLKLMKMEVHRQVFLHHYYKFRIHFDNLLHVRVNNFSMSFDTKLMVLHRLYILQFFFSHFSLFLQYTRYYFGHIFLISFLNPLIYVQASSEKKKTDISFVCSVA